MLQEANSSTDWFQNVFNLSSNIIDILNLRYVVPCVHYECVRYHYDYGLYTANCEDISVCKTTSHCYITNAPKRSPTASPLGSKSCVNCKKTREQKRELHTQWSLQRQWDYKLVTPKLAKQCETRHNNKRRKLFLVLQVGVLVGVWINLGFTFTTI